MGPDRLVRRSDHRPSCGERFPLDEYLLHADHIDALAFIVPAVSNASHTSVELQKLRILADLSSSLTVASPPQQLRDGLVAVSDEQHITSKRAKPSRDRLGQGSRSTHHGRMEPRNAPL